jgi:ferredoxin
MSTSQLRKRNDFHVKKLIVPGIVMLLLEPGNFRLADGGYIQPLIMFGYIGTSSGWGWACAVLPKSRNPWPPPDPVPGRPVPGGIAILMGKENVQIEGFLFGLLTGVIQMAVIHYFIAKLVGPLLFGRLWCGWACWTVMVLDLLPFKRPAGRLPGRWGWLRYLHFGFSLGLVLVLFFVFGYRDGAAGRQAVIWFIGGNLAYYTIGIVLAYALRDNRAFCKYVCPVSVPLKITSRFSLLKIGGKASQCNNCGACVKMCPMDVRIPDYILNGERVLSTECSLCQTCTTVCAKDALKLSFGFDLGGKTCCVSARASQAG